MKSIQKQIFIFFTVLLFLVQAIAIGSQYRITQKQEESEIQKKLDHAKSIFNTQFDSRTYYLKAFSETAAQDFGLKQVFTEDTRSFLVALNNHRQRINADLALAINPEGKVTGQLLSRNTADGTRKIEIGSQQGLQFPHSDWLTQRKSGHLYKHQGSFYQLGLARISNGSQLIGWIGFGYRIDTALAQQFSELTGLVADFAYQVNGHWNLLATSNQGKGAVWQQEQALVNRLLSPNPPDNIIFIPLKIHKSNELMTLLYGSRQTLLANIQQQWIELFILALFILSLSLLGTYLLAANITTPIKKLVLQVKAMARGHYQQQVECSQSNEVGLLASEFNILQQAVKEREATLKHSLNHEPTTGLPNRNKLTLVTEQLIANRASRFALFQLNITRTKEVNNTLGYTAGNLVIKEVGERLSTIKQAHLLCHLGADQFVLLINQVSELEIEDWVYDINEILAHPMRFQGLSLQISTHIGISLYPQHGNSAGLLLRRADSALNKAKDENNYNFQLYQEGSDVHSIDRLRLLNDLKEAIETGQLSLYYQPKLSLASQRVCSVEALVRWHHPQQGMVQPDSFIHLAEKIGQIDALTFWVLNEAARQYKHWRQQDIQLSIAVNVSATSLVSTGFFEQVLQIFNRYQLPISAISIEVTENAVAANPEEAIRVLQAFKSKGIEISIDDYGTGYSSMAQLKDLPVTELKIDKAFIQHLTTNEADKIIVRSTIELAHNMGLSVVAEGVEDEATLTWLMAKQCEKVQGYYISHPLQQAELVQWLRHRPCFSHLDTRAKVL